MKRNRLIILVVLSIISTTPIANAGEIYEFYNGVRPLGMGGAYVTTVNDETALWLNPAGLGRLRDPYFTFADPEFEMTSEVTNILPFADIGDATDVQKLLDALNKVPGKHFHSRFQISPSIVIPNFGIGGLMRYSIDGAVDPTGTTYTYDYTSDWALALGYNFRLFSGVIKLGFNVKAIDRIEVHEELPATSTELTLKDIGAEGVGISTDVGLTITAPIRYLPAIGAVIHDVGDTTFTLSDGMRLGTEDRRPAMKPQSIDAGLSIQPILGRNVRATFTAEVHDITTEDEEEKKVILRRLHGGMEFNIADFFFLRGGMNQGYWTAGLEFSSERFQLQAACYGEDIGTPDEPKEDRRFVGKFSLRF